MSKSCSECGGPEDPSGRNGFIHAVGCWHIKSSVLRIEDWMGWEDFMDRYARCEDAYSPDCTRRAFLVLFNGGFRRGEAILIRMDQIAWNDEAIAIYRAPVFKKKRRSERTRDVMIKIDDDVNPLARELLKIVETQKTEYLLPAKVPFTGEDKMLGSMSSKTVYNRMKSIGMFPHELRGYRAMQLVAERGYSPQDLMGFFKWTSADMAMHYTRTKDMASRMGIRDIPRLKPRRE